MLAAIVLVALAGAPAAVADPVTHNGLVSYTAGTIIPGTGQVAVALTSNPTIPDADPCGGSSWDHRLLKTFMPGSETQIHNMIFEPAGSDFSLHEIVVNETGVPWLGFHFSIENMIGIAPPQFVRTPNFVFGQILDLEVEGVGSSLDIWIEFDEPFGTGEYLDILLPVISPLTDGPVTITQHATSEATIEEPATLALLGLGLVGLAAMRRRRRG